MKRIPKSLIKFIEKQHLVLMSTVNKSGVPNTSPKGVAMIESKGKIYVIDLYFRKTWRNLKHNKHVTLCCYDERHFRGYQFKGVATAHKLSDKHDPLVRLWRKKISSRITHRVIENLRFEKKTHHHEAHFPPPKYIIKVDVKEIISLTGNA